MSSSREVTAQKKKDVWEEAGGEFYQESYPCGSKRPNNTHHRRPSRLGIPLPSHTARRGSLLQGRTNNKTGGGRRKLLTNNTGARAGQTFTSTMATADVNGTTTNVNDIQVAILPDLSEETILNERKTWEELLRIKSMPVPMAQKKLLKAQLTNLPKLRLKGIAHFKYVIRKSWKAFTLKLSHTKRRMILFNGSLRMIELRRGTSITNVFLLIKLTLLLNLAMSLAMICFVLGPYIAYDLGLDDVDANSSSTPTVDFYSPTCVVYNQYNESVDVTDPVVHQEFLECCRAGYIEEESKEAVGIHNTITRYTKALGMGDYRDWPIHFSYYHESHLSFDGSGERKYPFAVAYVFTGCLIMVFCLFLLVYNISDGVKEIIKLREGEFFKYSNLIFSGWDHYTIDEKGAEFKRGMIRNEMQLALHTEKKKITDTGRTRKERLKLLLVRIFVNVFIIGLLVGAGAIIVHMTEEFTNFAQRQKYDNSSDVSREGSFQDFMKEFSPSMVISFFNLIFPILLARIGKWEEFSKEVETGLVLLRSLVIRLISIYAAAKVFHKNIYCKPIEGTCNTCDNITDSGEVNEESGPVERERCWEGHFATEVYKLVITELAIKTFLTFVFDPLRRLTKYCCKNKIGRRIGTLSFNIVRHSLDIIYIQILAWMSFYYAPFMPIVTTFYCYLIFYIKRFGVLNNVNYVPDTFRTTRTTAVFLAAKVLSFVVVLFTYAFILGYMVPSRGCGPFRGKSSAWEAVAEEFQNVPWLISFLDFIFPGGALPITLVLLLLTYYYYSVAQANRAMVETLRHLLILEGHDKQYLFSKLNSLRRTENVKTRAKSRAEIRKTVYRDPRLKRQESVVSQSSN